MSHRIISAILVAFLTLVCSPDLIKGQSIDSLLYVLDNDLVEDDSEKYDLLRQLIKEINDTESKIRYCDQAIELALKLDILPSWPYLEKGDACLASGNYPMALQCYIQAASYYEEIGNSGGLGTAYNLIAQTYNLQGNRENEKLYLQNALEIFELEKDSVAIAYTLHNLGFANYSMGQYDTALVAYTETLDLLKKFSDPYSVYSYFVCLGNLGLVYSRLSDFDKAEVYLLTAMDTLASLDDEYAVPEFMIGYASILQQKGQIELAISYASKALENTDNPYYERDASSLLARLYKISGRIDSAYYYQSIFIVANDSVKNIRSVQKMADLRTEYEVGKKQVEVDVLEKVKLRNTIIIIGLGIILILAIGLVTLYNKNLKRSRKLTIALEERRVLLVKQSS
ncbi:MAG: tetratricopeptide repeat protein, partial [Cyclobacteriaceae bacterium]|nr:tetratricopeptide repeat protein [Cyclobacteriaceae bacterium]